MKRRYRDRLLTIVMIIVLAAALSFSALADIDEPISGGDLSSAGISASKYVYLNDDGTYRVEIEAFVTGTVTTEYIPCDVILVLDTSESMNSGSMGTVPSYNATSARTGVSWTNMGGGLYRNTMYYYKDGNTYRQITIERQGTSGTRQFSVTVEGYSEAGTAGLNTNNLTIGNNQTNVVSLVQQALRNSGVTGATVQVSDIFTLGTRNYSRLEALKDAVNLFLDNVAEVNDAADDREGFEPADYNRVSIVTYNQNTAVQTGNKEANEGSFVAVTKGDVVDSLKSDVSGFGYYYYTHTADAMGTAETILEDLLDVPEGETPPKRNQIVVLFTDGYPRGDSTDLGSGSSSMTSSMLAPVVNSALTCKNSGAKVFTVAILPNEAMPGVNPVGATNASYGAGATTQTRLVNQMLQAASSNYPAATATTADYMTVNWGSGDYTQGYFMAAESADDLKEIFKKISEEAAASTDLGTEAVMRDIVSSSFTLPPAVLESEHPEDAITVHIVRWNTETRSWGTGSGYVFTPEEWKTECRNYGADPDAEENISVTISEDGTTMDLTGFDYATHFKATNDDQDADPDFDQSAVNKNTAKVVVEFQIMAKPSAITGGEENTNGEMSGMYINGESTEPIVAFPLPKVVFKPVTYVVDYVTSDTTATTDASVIILNYSDVLSNVEMLDDPSDDVLVGERVEDFDFTIYKGRYGTIAFGRNPEQAIEQRTVTYLPTTMNWNGYDRIFVKGESATESDLDAWTMLTVVPANSVYYEDTFVTQTKIDDYGNGNVVEVQYTGIVYDSAWSLVGAEGGNTTQHAGDTMGWIDGLADDTTYANGSAHRVSADVDNGGTDKATATFTFSGTGVDIYSRTNGQTGTVIVNVKSPKTANESGKKVTKVQIIDTKAAAGDFFGIPVCSFTGLPYGEYTVTITVTSGAASEGRFIFYLDGVRVYNPIRPLESDGAVQQIYGEENMGAVFTTVRNLLGTGAEASALFIDEHTTSEIVTDLNAIEEAAQALAKAQDDLDAYIEGTITPAKNAISAEEFKKESAEAALDSASNIYNAAKKAYDEAVAAGAADDEIEKLKAEMDAAESEMNAARTAYEEALAEYNANIGDLKDALDAAIAGRAPYDEAVEAARNAYDEANDGVTLQFTTVDVAEYKKEGPKNEVLLSPGEQVAINVESGMYYCIGLKSLNGDDVTVQINGAELPESICHTVDLYYECTPTSGTIVIKNNSGADSGAILSVTKLRTTGTGNAASGTRLASTEETLAYVRSLANLAAIPYTGEVLSEEEAVETPVTEEPIAEEPIAEEPVAGEPDAETPDAEPGETVVDLDPAEITINNPEPAEPEPAAEEPAQTGPVDNGMGKILSSFFNFFRRR